MNEKIEFAEGFIDTGRYEKAIGYLNEIIDAGQNIKAYQLRGYAYYCMRDMESAIPDLIYVVEHDHSADLANYYLSQIYSFLSDFETAKKYIERAYAIDQENIEYLADYVTIEQTLKNYEHSIELCDKILADTPDSSFALNARGQSKLNLGRIDEAISDFAQTVKESPMDFAGWNNLGIAYLKKGDLEKAFDSFQHSLRQNPMNPDAYSFIGYLNYKKGNFDKALQYLNRALELDYTNTNAYRHRVLVYFAMKDMEKAREDLKYAEELGYKASEDKEMIEAMGSYDAGK